MDFAFVTWIVNQNIDSLSDKDKSFIDNLFTKYCDYAQGSSLAEKNVRYLLDVLLGKQYINNNEFSNTKIEIPLYEKQAVFGMNSPREQDEQDEKQNNREALFKQEIGESKLFNKKLKVIKKSKNHDKRSREEQVDNSLACLAQGQERQDKMLSLLLQRMEEHFENSTKGTMSVELHELRKGTQESAKKVNELYEMALQKQSLTDLKWDQIPVWFKEIYSAGIKNMAVQLIKLPLTIARIAVNRVIYRPMVRVYDFWSGKVEFVVGHIWWIIVIGTAIHIYEVTDWEYVNNIYTQFGGEYINKYAFSGIELLKMVPALMPSISEIVVSSFKFFFDMFFAVIFGIISTILGIVSALFTSFMNSLIASSSTLSYLVGPPTPVQMPNTTLFNLGVKIFNETLFFNKTLIQHYQNYGQNVTAI